MGLRVSETDDSVELQIRIAQIDSEFAEMLKAIASDNVEAFDDEKAKELMDEKNRLMEQLGRIEEAKQKRLNAASRLDDINGILDTLRNHPLEFNDHIIRQLLQCVVIVDRHLIKVVFIGGLTVEQEVEDEKDEIDELT